jgi:hypothetical protein
MILSPQCGQGMRGRSKDGGTVVDENEDDAMDLEMGGA